MQYVENGGSLYVSGKFAAPAEFLGVADIKDRPYEPCRGREYRETGPRYGYSLVPEAYFKMTDEKLKKSSPLLPVSDAVVGVPYMKRTLEYKIAEALPGAEILADLYLPAGGAFGEPLEFPYGTPPGIVLNTYGKGKVIWCAADIGLHYEARRLAESRNVLAKIFDMLAGEFFIRLNAPAGVVMNVTRSKDEYYLHLLNYCGAMQECGCAIEFISPLHNLEITLPGDFSVKCLSSGRDLVNRNGTVVLPELGVFETLVLRKNV
jgi:hypothetical protein